MNLKFNELVLTDFKGQRNFSIEFDDDLTSIVGDNATGKTTLLDAIFWIFFGKDSKGNKKFDLFPLDEKENIIEETIPTVELKMTLDGDELVLKKQQMGSSANCFIDDVPKKAKEYQSFVTDLIDEKLFMSMINPVFFGDQLKWQDQKSIVSKALEVEDTVIDEKKYSAISSDVKMYGVDDVKLKYHSKIKELGVALNKTKGERDYISKTLDGKSMDSDKNELIEQKDAIEKQINLLESGYDEFVQLSNRKIELKGQIQAYVNKKQYDIGIKQTEINNLKSQKNTLMTEYKSLNTQLNSIQNKCSLCGALLNPQSIDEQKNVLQEKINKIIVDGKTFKEKISLAEAELRTIESQDYTPFNITSELNQLENTIASKKDSYENNGIKELRVRKQFLDGQIREYDNVQKLFKDLQKAKKQVAKITDDLEDFEIKETLAKQYHQDYSQLVADELNKGFEDVKIKTFIVQKNGEIKETFEITMNGVPYKSLNSAGKIIAGVELIGLLSETLNINFPVVIDNKESIVKDFDIDNQLITMSVMAGAELGV